MKVNELLTPDERARLGEEMQALQASLHREKTVETVTQETDAAVPLA